jgi:hypothetical protein
MKDFVLSLLVILGACADPPKATWTPIGCLDEREANKTYVIEGPAAVRS